MKRLARSAILAPVLAAALIGTAFGASDTKSDKADSTTTPPGTAVIHFANLPHRIQSWTADGTKGIYLRVGVDTWYYATFRGPCVDLPFAQVIGIGSGPMNQVDRFSSIVVRSPSGPQRCSFKTVDRVKGPPEKSKKKD